MSLPKISATEAKALGEESHEIGDNNAITDFSSNCSSDSENTEAQIQLIGFREVNENEVPTFAVRMLNLCRELAIFCLVMVTYAALTKDPPKISKTPAAYPFFAKDSIVTDWYRGHISKAIEHARSSDVAFVMFYAPWDAESQAARREFETTAKYMSNYVTFAAVNCWQPNSECKNQYSKVYKWPVLIAYPSHGRGVQYNGPISAAHMIRFLQKVCNPILRLSSEKPREFQDAYVVANLNTSPGSLDFAVLYTTALKYLEKDPLQCITFYVNPQSASEPSLYLHLWNETLIFPVNDRDWRPDDILHWVFTSFHQVTAWVAPSGSKSLILSNNLQNGPSLILFTPKNPLHFNIDYYNMLQEIGNEYYNCDNNIMTNLHSINIKLKRSGNLLEFKKLRAACKVGQETPSRKIISHLNPKVWTNSSSCSKKDCILVDNTVRYFCSNVKNEECIEFAPIVTVNTERECERGSGEGYETSMLTGEKDPRSPENLLKSLNRERCRQFLTAQKLQPALFEGLTDVNRTVNITGLACSGNKSLTLLAMDSLLYYQFAENLGVDLSEAADKSAVVIINEKMESHYTMRGSIDSVSMSEFIQNFTKNELLRSLDSKTMLKSRNTQNSALKSRDKLFFVAELDTDSFLPTVLQDDKAVIVFYYTKQCGFCSGISYVLLTAAKKLSSVDDILFTRIDGDVNILPWEYTMDSYPTILFFPTNEKSESRVFPSNIPITVPNLIGFILTNLEPSVKLHAMWSICNQTKFEVEKASCFSSIQAETLTLIDQTLREWRKSNKRQKQLLLHKLKQLRQLHLLFAHSPQKYTLTQTYFKRLKSKEIRSGDYHNLSETSSRDEL